MSTTLRQRMHQDLQLAGLSERGGTKKGTLVNGIKVPNPKGPQALR
jgi:hypothetical protein